MTKHVTRWSPDTCGCQLEYEWDDNDPPERRSHNLFDFVHRCPAHSASLIADDSEGYNAVKDENTRKNIAYSEAVNNAPAELVDVVTDVDKDGNETTRNVLKKEITFDYEFTGTAPNRVLNIDLKGPTRLISKLDNTKKSSMRSAINKRLGTNKVVLK